MMCRAQHVLWGKLPQSNVGRNPNLELPRACIIGASNSPWHIYDRIYHTPEQGGLNRVRQNVTSHWRVLRYPPMAYKKKITGFGSTCWLVGRKISKKSLESMINFVMASIRTWRKSRTLHPPPNNRRRRNPEFSRHHLRPGDCRTYPDPCAEGTPSIHSPLQLSSRRRSRPIYLS